MLLRHFITFTLLCASLRLGHAASFPLPKPGTPATVPLGEVIDDDAIEARMIGFGTALMNSTNAVRMKTLIAQLKRPHCSLSLTAPGSTRLDSGTLLQQVRRGVLVVGSLYQCDKCNEWHLSAATGFALTESGAFATCYHVVNQREHYVMVVMADDGRMFGVREVLAASKAHDVAILQIDGTGLTPLPLATQTPAGSPVFVVSHPTKHFYTFTTGLVARHFVNEEDGFRSHMMSITADFGRGSSGCPVFNEFGTVVGMAESIVPTTSTSNSGEVMSSLVFKHVRPAAALLRLIRPQLPTDEPVVSTPVRH